MKKIYLSDDKDEIEKRISSRVMLYQGDYTKNWKHKEPIIHTTNNGEKVLYIDGIEVMADFEIPYMKKLSELVTLKGGDILNVGYGLGIADNHIETLRKKTNIKNHHIIELNNVIYNNAEKWKSNHLNKKHIHLHKGNWTSVLTKFEIQFTGILYDAFPLKKEDLCRDFIPFLKKVIELKLIKKGGIITFFLDSSDGFGKDFINLCNELVINKLECEKVKINLPEKRKPQGWGKSFFLAPKLTILNYKR